MYLYIINKKFHKLTVVPKILEHYALKPFDETLCYVLVSYALAGNVHTVHAKDYVRISAKIVASNCGLSALFVRTSPR